MDNNTNNEKILSWKIDEYIVRNRTKSWYIKASLIITILLLFCFFTSNFLFAVIIIISAFIIVKNDSQVPANIKIAITENGLFIGEKYYDYDEFKDFSIVYKPNIKVKNLYFNFKSLYKYRISIPLNKANPLPIREYLLNYLPEDLERTDQNLSESLADIFKL